MTVVVDTCVCASVRVGLKLDTVNNQRKREITLT